MANSIDKHTAKKFALDHAGETFQFYEENRSLPTMKGRIVGYYFSLALLVMECETSPQNAIDPLQSYLDSNGIRLTAGSYYCLIALSDIVKGTGDTEKVSLKYPNKCPRCGKPAYVGVVPNSVECSAHCKF